MLPAAPTRARRCGSSQRCQRGAAFPQLRVLQQRPGSAVSRQRSSTTITTSSSSIHNSSTSSTPAATHAFSPPAVAVRPITPAPQPLQPGTGFVANEASLSKVPDGQQWPDLLAAVADAYAGVCAAAGSGGARLLGVYLRGSLPQGHFLPGISDVDTYALLLPPAPAPQAGEAEDASAAAEGLRRQLERAVQDAVQPLVQQHRQRLGFTKIETKLLQLQPGGAAACALAGMMQQQQQLQQQLRPSVAADIPCAFELRSQSVCLRGLDLPQLLPACAALPPSYVLLPGLADDLAAAREAAAGADAPPTLQVSATRWALKRCLRAAFELVQEHTGCYTRDLFWCCQLAKQHHPQLQQQLAWAQPQQPRPGSSSQSNQQQEQWEQQLDQALHAYIDLQQCMQLWSTQQQDNDGSSCGLQSHMQQVMAGSWKLVDGLQLRLEALFLKLMLTEEPGWLPNHHHHHLGSSSEPAGSDEQQQKPAWPSFPGALLQLLARPEQRQQQQQEQAGGAPPPVQLPVWGQVQAYDWCSPQQRESGAAAVRELLLAHATTSSSSRQAPSEARQYDETQDELWGCWPQPVVLRGAAADWPCAANPPWDLAWLAQQAGFVGRVRVAPSLQFPFAEPQLLEVALRLRGVGGTPSLVVDMPAAEFVQRLTSSSSRLPACAYAPREYYYLQATLPPAGPHRQHVEALLGSINSSSGSSGGTSTQPAAWQLVQEPRLFVSPPGAVSPLHFDASPSFLVQAAGRKRMLFVSPDQLDQLYPYPGTHLLRRRSRVNVAAPDLARFPLFGGVGALEVVLQPGDCVVFPPLWAHYTESLAATVEEASATDGSSGGRGGGGCCTSLTFRAQVV